MSKAAGAPGKTHDYKAHFTRTRVAYDKVIAVRIFADAAPSRNPGRRDQGDAKAAVLAGGGRVRAVTHTASCSTRSTICKGAHPLHRTRAHWSRSRRTRRETGPHSARAGTPRATRTRTRIRRTCTSAASRQTRACSRSTRSSTIPAAPSGHAARRSRTRPTSRSSRRSAKTRGRNARASSSV